MGIRWRERFRLPDGLKRPGGKNRKLIAAALAVLLALAAGSGGAYVWMEQKRHGLASAVEKLNEAIATGDLPALSMRIDFSALSRGLVDAWSKTVPDKAPQTGIGRRELEDAVQSALHKAFTARRSAEKESGEKEPEQKEPGRKQSGNVTEEEKSGMAKDTEAAPADRLSEPIPPMPPLLPQDFAAQLAAEPFRILGEDGDQALVATRIRHQALSLDLPLQLLAVRKNGDWLFERLVNAEQLAAGYGKAEQAFRMRRESMFFARNAEIREVMNRHCYITGCQVGVAKVEKDGAALISLNLEGTNTGDETLRSAGLRCRIRDQAGRVVKDMPLNFSRRVKPESLFRQYWNFEFDADTPEARALIGGGKLTCTTEVQAVSLENGRLIYPRPYSELEDPAGGTTEKPK